MSDTAVGHITGGRCENLLYITVLITLMIMNFIVSENCIINTFVFGAFYKFFGIKSPNSIFLAMGLDNVD